jgi:hypothetical protein
MEKLATSPQHLSTSTSQAYPLYIIGIRNGENPLSPANGPKLFFGVLLLILFVAAVWQGVSAWREIHASVAETKENDPCAIETLD